MFAGTTSDAPIVILSAYHKGKKEWENRIDSLAKQVLCKPVQIEQIPDAISAAVKSHNKPVKRHTGLFGL